MKQRCFFLLLCIYGFQTGFSSISAAQVAEPAATANPLRLSTAGSFDGKAYHHYVSSSVGGLNIGAMANNTCIGCAAVTDAVAGGVEVPAGALTVNAEGIAGYCVTHADSRNKAGAPGAIGNCAGGYFHSIAEADHSAVWGLNPVVNDIASISGHKIVGLELDLASYATAGAASFDGIEVFMGAQKFPGDAAAFKLFSDGKHPVPYGITFGRNAATTGIQLFPGCPGGEDCGSQSIDFVGTSSQALKQSYLYADQLGDQMINETAPNTSLISTGGYSFQFPNNGGEPTANNHLAILAGNTATLARTDSLGGVIGLVINSGGGSGKATILVMGPGICMFDGPTAAGHYFQASESVPGACHDTGPGRPRFGQILGLITQSTGGGGAGVLMEVAP